MSKFFDDTMLGLIEAATMSYKNFANAMEQYGVKRIYEDDNWVIDLVDGNIRVSYFENCHYVDEITVTKEYFKNGTE